MLNEMRMNKHNERYLLRNKTIREISLITIDNKTKILLYFSVPSFYLGGVEHDGHYLEESGTKKNNCSYIIYSCYVLLEVAT